jgi:DHA2 family multidrug resistance protein-like MFS transporter
MVGATVKATRREWIGLAVLALPCLLYSMDLTVLHLAVPKISADLKPSSAQLLWIIDIYGFFVAGSLITMGTLGDRIGRRKLLLIGAVAFGVASVIAASSTSAEMLIASRAVLGVAGATLAPSTLSLLRNMFLDEQERTQAIAVIITSYSAGAAIGPLVGGAVLQAFWWGAVFLIAVPVMILLLVLGPRLLPEYRDARAGRPDLVSAVLSVGALLAVIYGLKQIAQDGVAWVPVAAIVVGVAIGALFVRRQMRLADPLLDLGLFRMPGFGASVTAYAAAIFVLFGGFLFLPQYLQLVLGLSPLEAGIWSVPWALAFVVGSMITPRVSARLGPPTLMAAGLVLAAVGFALFTQVGPTTGIAPVVIGSVVFALGTSPVFPLTNAVILGAAPPERAGAASGMSETSAEVGGALGIAIFGSLGVAAYRAGLASVPPGIPPDAAAAARDTLGAAIAVAAGLPSDLAGPLVALARDAFVQGLHIAAAASAVGSVALAIFVVRTLRGVGAAAPEAIAPEPSLAVGGVEGRCCAELPERRRVSPA